MKAKNNNVRLTTPKGLAQYPSLKEPDTRFDPAGVYKVNLVMDDNNETNALINKLTQILEDFYDNDDNVKQAIAKGRKVSMADIYENDNEGNIILKFKQKAVITKKDGTEIPVTIRQFDSKGKPMSAEIGRDSVIKVAFTPSPYYMPSTRTCGLSLRLNAVQVIDLVEFSGGTADSYGFGEEEGFEYDDKEAKAKEAFKDDFGEEEDDLDF